MFFILILNTIQWCSMYALLMSPWSHPIVGPWWPMNILCVFLCECEVAKLVKPNINPWHGLEWVCIRHICIYLPFTKAHAVSEQVPVFVNRWSWSHEPWICRQVYKWFALYPNGIRPDTILSLWSMQPKITYSLFTWIDFWMFYHEYSWIRKHTQYTISISHETD